MNRDKLRDNRRHRCSLNLTDEEWAKVKAVTDRLGECPTQYIRDLVMGEIEDELEGLGIEVQRG